MSGLQFLGGIAQPAGLVKLHRQWLRTSWDKDSADADLGRIHSARSADRQNPTKRISYGQEPEKKMLRIYERSQYVYENK